MTHNLTRNDVLRLININKADGLNILLDENPTTGYLWHVSESQPVEIHSAFKQIGVEVGGGGQRTFTLCFLKTGRVDLNFKLYRPWLGVLSTIDELKFSFDIRD